MDKWKWIVFVSVAVLTMGAVILSKPPSASFAGDPAKVVSSDHVYGNKDAKVVVIEYADFQCPGCGALFSPLKQATAAFKDKIAFVYRYMPLTSIHPNAKAAAAAAESAGRQGKFWEMHDLLYTNQSQWSEASASSRGSYFEAFAQQLGLNMTQYKKDVGSQEVSDRISLDLAAANKAGIQPSTPTVVINGTLIKNTDLSEAANGNTVFSAKKISQLFNTTLKSVGEAPLSDAPSTQSTAPATQSNQ